MLMSGARGRTMQTARMTRRMLLLALLFAPPALADAPLTGAAAYGDWHADAPGVVRHITPDAMPPPNATLSAHRFPSVVTRPAGAMLFSLTSYGCWPCTPSSARARTRIARPIPN